MPVSPFDRASGNADEDNPKPDESKSCRLKEESAVAAAKQSQIFSHAASFQRLASDLFKLQEAAMVLHAAGKVSGGLVWSYQTHTSFSLSLSLLSFEPPLELSLPRTHSSARRGCWHSQEVNVEADAIDYNAHRWRVQLACNLRGSHPATMLEEVRRCQTLGADCQQRRPFFFRLTIPGPLCPLYLSHCVSPIVAHHCVSPTAPHHGALSVPPQVGASVEIEVSFREELYPFYPPTVTLRGPRMQPGVHAALTAHPMLQYEHWNPLSTNAQLLGALSPDPDPQASFLCEWSTRRCSTSTGAR